MVGPCDLLQVIVRTGESEKDEDVDADVGGLAREEALLAPRLRRSLAARVLVYLCTPVFVYFVVQVFLLGRKVDSMPPTLTLASLVVIWGCGVWGR